VRAAPERPGKPLARFVLDPGVGAADIQDTDRVTGLQIAKVIKRRARPAANIQPADYNVDLNRRRGGGTGLYTGELLAMIGYCAPLVWRKLNPRVRAADVGASHDLALMKVADVCILDTRAVTNIERGYRYFRRETG